MSSPTPRVRYFGASHDLAALVKTHLFVICPNNSGSTFLKRALATSRHTWNLMREGQHTFGFAGPSSNSLGLHKRWAAEPRSMELYTKGIYDWEATRRAWYFQAHSWAPDASIFVEKSPPFVMLVDRLAEQFPNARFLFMVRDPYAVVEGIVRGMSPGVPAAEGAMRSAAHHVVNCLELQWRNVAKWPDRGVFFSYETMCGRPEQVERLIGELVPRLDDVTLRQRLRVRQYHEPLRDMNEQQIARLGPARVRQLTDIFVRHQDVLDFFGYSLRG